MGIEILDKAIEFEKEGIKFYSKALRIIQHDLCREIIQLFLEYEEKHIEELKYIYKVLKQNGPWPEKETVLVEDKLKNIFQNTCDDLDKKIKPSTDEKEFLELSMDLEIKGKELYKKLAVEAQDKKEKEFYSILSKEEEKHYEILEQYCNFFWDSGLRMQE